MKALTVLLFIVFPFSIWAESLELLAPYGTRLAGMGGSHITLSDNAYAPFYNPAIMLNLDKTHMAANIHQQWHQREVPLSAHNSNTSSRGSQNFLFYAGTAMPVTDRVAIGFAVYPSHFQEAHYSSVDFSNDLLNKEMARRDFRLEFAPSLALKVIGPLSIGVSHRIGLMKSTRSFGSFEEAYFGESELSGVDLQSFKVGAHFGPFRSFAAAISWRFSRNAELSGDLSIEQEGAEPETHRVSSEFKIPGQLQLSTSYEAIPGRLQLAFSYVYTQDQVLDQQEFVDKNTGENVLKILQQLQAKHSLHLGAEYQVWKSSTQGLTALFGLSAQRSSTKTSHPSPLGVPPGYRTMQTTGLQYERKHHHFGFATAFSQHASSVSQSDLKEESEAFAGRYSSRLIVLSFDYQFSF